MSHKHLYTYKYCCRLGDIHKYSGVKALVVHVDQRTLVFRESTLFKRFSYCIQNYVIATLRVRGKGDVLRSPSYLSLVVSSEASISKKLQDEFQDLDGSDDRNSDPHSKLASDLRNELGRGVQRRLSRSHNLVRGRVYFKIYNILGQNLFPVVSLEVVFDELEFLFSNVTLPHLVGFVMAQESWGVIQIQNLSIDVDLKTRTYH